MIVKEPVPVIDPPRRSPFWKDERRVVIIDPLEELQHAFKEEAPRAQRRASAESLPDFFRLLYELVRRSRSLSKIGHDLINDGVPECPHFARDFLASPAQSRLHA